MAPAEEQVKVTDEGAAAGGVGYGRPPTTTRFKKGQSGNPRGRPPNLRRKIPYDTVLGQMVTIREDGRERRVTAAEAFLLQLTRKGLQGDSSAARASLQAIETARAKAPLAGSQVDVLRVIIRGVGVSPIIGTLGMAIKRFPLDKQKVRWELNTWIVDAALARLGKRRLTVDEQREVVAVLRNRAAVCWPDWWVVRS